MKTAILVDGGFFLKRYVSAFGKNSSALDVCDYLHKYCYKHLNEKVYDSIQKLLDDKAKKPLYHFEQKHEMYRIFYYDCAPIDKVISHPIKGSIDLKRSPTYIWKSEFLNELKKKRKLALRLGELSMNRTGYTMKERTLRKIIKSEMEICDLSERDFILNIEQKGVDMRIGLDVASMAYKKQVERIVLIAGDSDFVPVAKMARREGIDFVLDPLYNNIKDNLFEHIDGLNTCDVKFNNSERHKQG